MNTTILLGLATISAGLLVAPAQAGTAAPPCAGVGATIVGTAGEDRLVGTSGRDVIVGLGGDDVLIGAGGDDLVCGNAGHDVLRGGPGDDVLRVGPADDDGPFDLDLVIYDTARRGVRVDLEAGTATGQGRDVIIGRTLRVYGSEHDDVLVGFGNRPNVLAGQGGDDHLVGGREYDQLYGDNARVTKVAGDDVLEGRGAGDGLRGGPGDDVVRGGRGADYLYAVPGQPSGSDRYLGGQGGDGFEDVVGPGEHDVYSGGADGAHLWLRTRFFRDGKVVHPSGRLQLDGEYTTFGDDPATGTVTSVHRVILPIGSWTLIGTSAGEALWAPRGVTDPERRGVTIRGRGGDDIIIGTEYDDVLIGGDGVDEVCGRGGADEIEAEFQAEDPIDLCEPR